MKKIISGGQIGAEQAGLEAGKLLGLETGGHIPKGYRISDGTEKGNAYDPSLSRYNLMPTPEWGYRIRTKLNIENSCGTVWFGNVYSPGGYTSRYARELCKPFLLNPDSQILKLWANEYQIAILNVAGNRNADSANIIEIIVSAFKA